MQSHVKAVSREINRQTPVGFQRKFAGAAETNLFTMAYTNSDKKGSF